MKTLLCVALFAVTALSRGAAPPSSESELPSGVAYAAAPAGIVAAARGRLLPALDDAAAMAVLLAPDNDESVRVGAFFGIEIEGDGLKAREAFGKGRYRLPPSDGMPEMISNSFGAQSRPQKLLLAHYVTLAANFSGDVTIREPNFEELALVWTWIGWDLDGPVLVAESANDKYFFDFDPAGEHITWIERLSHPCFTGSQENKPVLSCTCARIDRDGRNWRLGYQMLESCPATGLHNVAIATKAGGTADAGKLPTAYVRVTDKSARVDAMMIRRFVDAYAVSAVDADAKGYVGPGKLLEGKMPGAPKDERGEPIHGYVLLGSAIGPDGKLSLNRILLSTDERISAAVLESARSWRVEPATFDGKPVTELTWQELTL